ncbi:MAG TPA: hypothetical protein VGB85_32795 [Nannocystis sp.]
MARSFYRNVLPDFTGLENETSEVNVVERDGSIGLSMTQGHGEGWSRTQVFMTPEQGHELLRGLLEAIDRAERQRSLRRPN